MIKTKIFFVGMAIIAIAMCSVLNGCEDSRDAEIQRLRSSEMKVTSKQWKSFANEQERIFSGFAENYDKSEALVALSDEQLIDRLGKNYLRVLNNDEVIEDTTECEDYNIGGGGDAGDDSTAINMVDIEGSIAYAKQHSTNQFSTIFAKLLRTGVMPVTKAQIINDREMLNIEKAKLLTMLAFMKSIKKVLTSDANSKCLDNYNTSIYLCELEAIAILGTGCLASGSLAIGAATVLATIHYESCAAIADKEFQECKANENKK